MQAHPRRSAVLGRLSVRLWQTSLVGNVAHSWGSLLQSTNTFNILYDYCCPVSRVIYALVGDVGLCVVCCPTVIISWKLSIVITEHCIEVGTANSVVAFRFSPKWLIEILNDTTHRAVSLRQLSFLFAVVVCSSSMQHFSHIVRTIWLHLNSIPPSWWVNGEKDKRTSAKTLDRQYRRGVGYSVQFSSVRYTLKTKCSQRL